MVLRIKFKDPDRDDAILSLVDNEWQFFVRFGSRQDTENFLVVSNTMYNMTNSQFIFDFFNSMKNVPYEEIADVQLFYDNEDGGQLFSADSLGFTYNTMFIEYKYNSNMLQEGTKDRGLIYTFVFRDKIEE